MSVTKTQYKMNDTITLESIWLEIRTHLEKKKNQIHDEIVNYPPPIPACDVQFNYLLEERTRITQELSRVREVSGRGTDSGDSARLLHEFMDSCAYIDDALKAVWERQVAQLAKQTR